MFSQTNENRSWYIDDNINTYIESGQVNASDQSFEDSNIMSCKIKKKILIYNILPEAQCMNLCTVGFLSLACRFKPKLALQHSLRSPRLQEGTGQAEGPTSAQICALGL